MLRVANLSVRVDSGLARSTGVCPLPLGWCLLMQEQPLPTPNDRLATWDIVIDDMHYGPWIHKGLVISDMKGRDEIGQERYGTRLQSHNGRDSLRDAYEEVLDACVYMKNVQLEDPWEDTEIDDYYRLMLGVACKLRARLLERDGK